MEVSIHHQGVEEEGVAGTDLGCCALFYRRVDLLGLDLVGIEQDG
jgi:hypothetical protein